MKIIITLVLAALIFTSCKKEIAKTEKKQEIEHISNTALKAKEDKSLTALLIRTNTIDFKTKIEGKNVQLIDVRTPQEYKDGHIPKAKNIDIYNDDFMQKASVLDKFKPVYIYCHSGVRSMEAAKKLKNVGFKVYNLNDGIKGWEKEGNSIEK